MTEKTDPRPTVRLKPADYQPGRAELDEPIVIRNRDGTIPAPSEMARTTLRPMTITEDDDA